MNNVLFRILFFFLIAVVYNYFLKAEAIEILSVEYVNSLSGIMLLLFSPLFCLGTLLGAIISRTLLSRKRSLVSSLGGHSLKWSIIFCFVPLVLLGGFGVSNNSGSNEHVYGFLIGLGLLIYSFSEEIGWRGYLNEELLKFKEWQRVLLVTLLWYSWHLTFLNSQFIFLSEIRFFGLLLLASFGLGKVIQSTKSILLVSTFHMLINMAIFNPFLGDKMPSRERLIIVLITFLIFFLVRKKWKERSLINEKVS